MKTPAPVLLYKYFSTFPSPPSSFTIYFILLTFSACHFLYLFYLLLFWSYVQCFSFPPCASTCSVVFLYILSSLRLHHWVLPMWDSNSQPSDLWANTFKKLLPWSTARGYLLIQACLYLTMHRMTDAQTIFLFLNLRLVQVGFTFISCTSFSITWGHNSLSAPPQTPAPEGCISHYLRSQHTFCSSTNTCSWRLYQSLPEITTHLLLLHKHLLLKALSMSLSSILFSQILSFLPLIASF